MTETDKIYLNDCNKKIQELIFRKSQLKKMLAECTDEITYYKERIKEIKQNLPLNEDFSNINTLTILTHMANKNQKLNLAIGSGYDKVLHPDSKSKIEDAIRNQFAIGLLQLVVKKMENNKK